MILFDLLTIVIVIRFFLYTFTSEKPTMKDEIGNIIYNYVITVLVYYLVFY